MDSSTADVYERVASVLSRALELDKEAITPQANVNELCVMSLKGTAEERDEPSPKDGIRPSDCLWMCVVLDLEDEFGEGIPDGFDEEWTVNGLVQHFERKST